MSLTALNALFSASPALKAIDTCHSTWLFDEENRRFRRVLRNDLVREVSTEWRPYDRLVMEPSCEAFVVVLDPRGTRVLRGRRCGSGCGCGAVPDRTPLPVAPEAPPLVQIAGGRASRSEGAGATAARVIPLPRPVLSGARARSARAARR